MKNVNENNTNVNINAEENYTPNAKPFAFGQVVLTRGIAELIEGIPHMFLMPYLLRHAAGDWGDVCIEDKIANDEATHNGKRVLSAYQLFGQKIWVITEWDRSATTILFPHEY
ncbi:MULTISPECIES: type I restriction endonuclease subunit M [Vibrio harveyi group]|uniref:type I restriction endonuclease subunit M n=1 Tax=Vibrio harveyi group TaxID=717610 RepID=UPI000A3B2306|nr:type I restriction endonuclease subunit M [Vibrio parahaemolyticus]MBY7720075.1 type I restriction endonuclease subunit M [Vibrio parahaemolyticus]MCZ6376992.1 type I restriction endonuclease subunit M [Vibrio parahaemolyticus]MDF4661940.1 type I restriction endonuclease subunit M [Vibrio parahaemolyticus]MDF4906453.1 type I restriction endonuclease subunit M [Vibrio parahaemolyticus]MDG3418693.1 type I restriction endonuclease subunit M [Vibrio parahaemolyticus]